MHLGWKTIFSNDPYEHLKVPIYRLYTKTQLNLPHNVTDLLFSFLPGAVLPRAQGEQGNGKTMRKANNFLKVASAVGGS